MTWHNVHGTYQYIPDRKLYTAPWGNRLKREFVHTRVRIQRGQSFVSMITQCTILVTLLHQTMPQFHWAFLIAASGGLYLTFAWLIGYIDDKMLMARMEQGWYAERNPQLNQILECVQRLEKKQ